MAREIGFDLCGITSADVIVEAQERYKEWIHKGYHATMGWLEDIERRTTPRMVIPEAESVIMLALNYYSEKEPEVEEGKVARYARGRDYHKVIAKMQKDFCRWLSLTFPGHTFRSYVDYGPFMERPYAEKAGLGFIGKNGMLITQEFGSYVFLAEIITSLKLEFDAPGVRRCGTCTRCHTACPTGAFVEDGMLDAKKCLAFYTIESKEEDIPKEIREVMKGRAFGCDICQEVCPYNNALRNKETSVEDFSPRYAGIAPDHPALKSDEEFFSTFAGTPIMRTKRKGMRRNLDLGQEDSCQE